MSASPAAAAQSAKRPLEDESNASQSGEPDAKRPALDKNSENVPESGVSRLEISSNNANGIKAEGEKLHAIPSSVPSGSSNNTHQDESQWIHIRAVISSAEAATIIGKGGENVATIRKDSGAKCTVSDYQKGAVERILTVSGTIDTASKAFGLIVRTLNHESVDEPSGPNSKNYHLRLLVPNVLIGAVIGKQGAKIKEIQEASGARLNASDCCLPLSTERTLIVLGVADAIHIAVYYIGIALLEQLTARFGGPSASAYATRNGAPAGVIPGGMQVVPYNPQSAGGSYGHVDNLRHHDYRSRHAPAPYQQPYAAAPVPQQGVAPVAYGAPVQAGYGGVGPQQPHQAGHAGPAAHAGPPVQPVQGALPGQPLTQQIYIPNDMVGAIIGKGGAKINEIRQLSGSVIKINEPQDNSNERLVTITGTAECNQMALYMLYSRLESEKHRV